VASEARSALIRAALSALALLVVVAVGLVFLDDRAAGPGAPGEAPGDGDLVNGRAFVQDNLWTAGDEQYAVWAAEDGTPLAGRRASEADAWDVVDLAALPGNPLDAPTDPDDHNVYVVGVDAAGHVHVAGNMHNDPLRYVRTRVPGDLGTFEAAGVAGPADEVTYPRFVGLPDGTLLFFRREGGAGRGETLLDRIGPGDDGWEHVGTVLDGTATRESPYLHRVAVDPDDGRIHLVVTWRASPDPDTANDVGYLASADGGRTWATSTGRPVALPATHDSVETVVDTADTGSGLVNQGGAAVDAQGRPHALLSFTRGGERVVEHLWLDDDGWRREPLDLDGAAARPALAAVDGRLEVLSTVGTTLAAWRLEESGRADARRELTDVPRGWEPAFDGQAAAGGRLQSLVPEDRRPALVTVPAP
jgi:hypothetical protein